MKRSKFTDEQILAVVREGEAGRKVADLCRTHGISEQTYYRWKAKYGGMELSEMQRLKQVEDENRRLKQIVAEQTLDIQALKAINAKIGRIKAKRVNYWKRSRGLKYGAANTMRSGRTAPLGVYTPGVHQHL